MAYNKRWVVYHQPCPKCGSSDALSIDSEGHGWCFSCESFHKDYYKEDNLLEEKQKEVLEEVDYWPHRGLWRQTLEFFDIKTKFIDGEPVETGFVWPEGGIRVRRLGEDVLKKDRFYSAGNMSNPGLLFKDKFDPGSKDAIVITKSGYDAASIYQIMGGSIATVAVSSGSVAKRDLVS